jgi:transketolase
MVERFSKVYPNRLVEVGIAEQNMIGVAAGIASTGKIVFANTMANFLTLRALEQIKVDVIYNEFNVKLVGGFAGILGGVFGPTHQGLEDIAVCRSLPHMKVVVPSDEYEVKEIVRAAVADESPFYIRLEREEPVERTEHNFEVGKAAVFREGKDVTLVACGSMLGFSVRAAEILHKKGIHAGVLDMCTIQPIDAKAILKAGVATGAIVTVEEHQITGGLGSAVAEVIAERAPGRIRLRRIGFENTIVETIGNPTEILKAYRLMPEDIAAKAGAFVRAIRK